MSSRRIGRGPRWRGALGLLAVVTVLVTAACTGSPADSSPAPSAERSLLPGSPSAAPPASVAALPRVPWAGGPAYYERFPWAAEAGWARPDFFPIGVWYESVLSPQDVELDRAAGLNTYVELTSNSDPGLLRGTGMTALTSAPLPGHGPEAIGWLINDEVDMWAAAGDAPWTGNYPGQGSLCGIGTTGCGWTVMDTLSGRLPAGDGRMRYANFGKGVMMWLDDADAARFVNGWTDIASTDIYWYTDSNICAEAQASLRLPADQCRRAANYGRTMDRTRELDARDGRLQPILAFVQLGWPGTADERAIRPEEVVGAVMNSIIHEARGIIYFNHNFGGPCLSQHVLRDGCGAQLRPTVVALNQRIRQLAPVLNTQSLQHTFNPALDTMLKEHDGAYYVFAMPGPGTAPGSYALTLPTGVKATTVEVLFEDRTLPLSAAGTFTDTFDAEYTHHLYRITAS